MHFEILVEDLSGKRALDVLVPMLIGDSSFRIISYKGIGHIPKGLEQTADPAKRMLLANLPRLLSGYGRSQTDHQTVIVVCDLDNKDRRQFLTELQGVLDSCDPKPVAHFCLAIEEGEAWLLGDIHAVTTAFPEAKASILKSYVNDSICGTWEILADAIYPGGSKALSTLPYSSIGAEKCRWAESTPPPHERR